MTLTSVVLLIVSLVLAHTHACPGDAEKRLATLSEDFAILKKENTALRSKNKYLVSENSILAETSTGEKFRSKLKSMLQSGSSTMSVVKYFFPEELVLTDSGSFQFFPIDDSLEKHPFLDENFSMDESGKVTYSDGGNVSSIIGIDVSKHNGAIDWEKVAASGVRFAYIRCGLRGYESGKIAADENFQTNVEGAQAAGISVGTYFFSQAVNEDEAREEAEFVLDAIKDYNITLPVATDIEKVDGTDSTPRTNSISQEQRTANALAFCKAITDAGHTPMIYGNLKTFLMLLDMHQIEGIPKWYAEEAVRNDITPYFPYSFQIWQYDFDGSIDGITGDVDINIAFN
ncbi:MAG: glycoside hydrolase family 25 protein [Lachnospiraceae bacterium]|nr:glycoside hydrolase family 25 protein [Lachnospiraceae bacterium]